MAGVNYSSTPQASREEAPRFGTLDSASRNWSRWGASLLIHSLLVALLQAVSVAVPQVPRAMKFIQEVSLTAPPPLVRIPKPKLPRPKVVPVVKITPKPVKLPEPAPVRVTKADTPAPRIEKPVVLEAPRVETPVLASRQPLPVAELPPLRTAPKVTTGAFGSAAEPSTQLVAKSAVRREIATGGFGEGVVGGSGHVKGAVVQSSGFDRSGAGWGAQGGQGSGSGGGRGGGGVGKGGFDIPAAAEPAKHSGGPSAAAASPVEITFKPKPVYTEQARTQGIEGEVLLEVRFCSTGHVEVLRVVRGLGFGLDEAAKVAAAQIRFRPGLRDGAPVDTQGIVHIVFQHS